MSITNEKVTANLMSAVTDNEQSPTLNNMISIEQNQPQCKDYFEMDDAEILAKRIDDMNSPDYLHTVSLSELYDTAYQPKVQIIDDLLCSGVYLFAGAPKVGKSFFMAQLGYHVSGGISLWNYTVHKGTVLYLALEDHYTRIQKRLSKMFGVEHTDHFVFSTYAKSLREGLEGQLKRFLRDNPNTNLIIIDTLQRIRESGGEKYSYGSDYEIVSKLKQIADSYNICILIVHHTRKQSAEDSFDTISGTNGLLGAADGAFLLQKDKRTANEAVLDIVGRDQQDQKLHLLFDRERCIWHLTKVETELWKEPPEPLLESISKIISVECPVWSGSASELLAKLMASDGIDLSDIQPNVLMRNLNVASDRLWNEYGIRIENNRSHAGRIVKLTHNK